jgi:hypothetical protein
VRVLRAAANSLSGIRRSAVGLGIVLWVSAFPGEKKMFYYTHCTCTRFISEGIAEASEKFLRDAHILQKLFRYANYLQT